MSIAGYVAGTFTAGQQPTTSVWNELWSNDAAFNTFLTTNNSLTANLLATNAIELGYTSITSPVTTTSTSFVDATGLSSTVTVPAGGRDVEVTFKGILQNNTSISFWVVAILKDGTLVDQMYANVATANYNFPLQWSYKDTAPTAGSHTYKIQFASDNSGHTVTIFAGTISSTPGTPGPAYILVKAI